MEKATREYTKAHNTQLVLRTIYGAGEISRADVARLTGLTRTTVSDVVTELMREGLVAEFGTAPSSRGKPPIMLRMVDDSRHLIGIDLADNEFRGAVINLRGQVVQRVRLPIYDRDGEAALALVYNLVDQLVQMASSPVVGIGIGTPGLIDAKGVVVNAVNLDWHNLSLGEMLKARYGLPVCVANDSQVAALAEYTFGDSRDIANLVVIMVSRGTGAGIVLNRQLYYGDRFGAGEIGHVVVVENGELCRCGNHGCLETVASGRAIIRRAQALAQESPHSIFYSTGTPPKEIDAEAVVQAFNAGDEALRQAVAEAGRYLGVAVANLVGVLSVQKIVIAGSVAPFAPTLLEQIREEMQQRCLPALAQSTRIETTKLGSDIVVLGAAALLLAKEFGLP